MVQGSNAGAASAIAQVQQNDETDSGTVGAEVETDRRVCPECGADVFEKGAIWFELVCDDCGLVVEEDAIDYGPEWRAYDTAEHQKRSRVGAPETPLIHDGGLATRIDWRDRDHAGQVLSSDRRQQVERLRTWQERIRTGDARERSLQLALTEIDRIGSSLGIPDSVRERASHRYRRALDADLIRGRSVEGVAAAVIYIACREADIPRSLDEIEGVARVEQLELGRTYRYLAAELGIMLSPVKPQQFVPRFCSELDLSTAATHRALEAIDATIGDGALSGRSPAGYAAAAIYAVTIDTQEEQTQKDIAAVANVTSVTLRERYREQFEEFDVDTSISAVPDHSV